MSSCWNENSIIFVMKLVSIYSDGWIKIGVFGAHQESTPSQTWSNLLKVFEELRFDIKPWKMLFCEDFDLWSTHGWPRTFWSFWLKKHFERSGVRMRCAMSLYMFSWPHGEKMIFLDFLGSGMQIKGGQNTVLIVVPSLFDISSAMRRVKWRTWF